MTTRKKNEGKAKIKPTDAKATIAKASAETAAGKEVTDIAQTDDFPIVGIGASAGGLSAFEAFFSVMPADVDPNMAFLLVQHLAEHSQ
jgi:two-component system CheB/CheR fusion protein